MAAMQATTHIRGRSELRARFNFVDEVRALASRQQELDELLWDVFTLQRGTLPFVECSDGRLYSAATLRPWVMECYRTSGVIRSPVDQTILRRHGTVRTESVARLAERWGIVLDAEEKEGGGTWTEGTRIDLLSDLVVEPVEPGAEGDVIEWKVNIASRLSSDTASQMCMLAGLENEQEVTFSCRTVSQGRGRVQLMTPPPDDRLKAHFAAIVNELGIGAGGITNPECLGTVPLHTSDGKTMSWEDRMLLNCSETGIDWNLPEST